MPCDATGPFPGLRPFTRLDAPWFFGRKQQIADLRLRLQRHGLVAVVGGSGVGKSSLVHAGLLPKFAD
jgi:ABC-type phosphate transport system ATPase subunit